MNAAKSGGRALVVTVVSMSLGFSLLAAEPSASSVVTLPGGAPGIGFDDLRFAPSLGVLLVPAGRSGLLDLVDPASGSISSISGFSARETYGGGHGQGVTSADEGAGFLFATDRTSVELLVVNPKGRKIVSRAKLGGPPDYVRFVPATRELWVTQPDRDRIEVFRLGRETVPVPVSAGFIAVKGGPESLVIDSKRGRAYTHLWEGETVAIDISRRTIIATWRNGCKGSRGIALDESRGFLFAGCAEGKATVLSVQDGHELSSATSGDGVDIIDYDAGSSRLYLPGGKSATMAIFGVSPEGKLTNQRVVPTGSGSHCVAAVPGGTAYVCDPKRGQLLVFRESPHP